MKRKQISRLRDKYFFLFNFIIPQKIIYSYILFKYIRHYLQWHATDQADLRYLLDKIPQLLMWKSFDEFLNLVSIRESPPPTRTNFATMEKCYNWLVQGQINMADWIRQQSSKTFSCFIRAVSIFKLSWRRRILFSF